MKRTREAAGADHSAKSRKPLAGDDGATTATPSAAATTGAVTTGAGAVAGASTGAGSPAPASADVRAGAGAGAGAARRQPWAEVGHSSHRGLRKTLEDEVIIMDDPTLRSRCPALPPQHCFGLLAVIDGHGGRAVATLVRDQLPNAVAAHLSKCPPPLKKSAVKAALRAAFAATAEAAVAACRRHGWTDGACVVACLLMDDWVFVANVGDSAVVLCRRTSDTPATPAATPCALSVHTFGCACPPPTPVDAKRLSQEHKAIMVEERARIEAAGGVVEDGRVNGALEVSRSFGDVALRGAGVVSDPDLRIAFKAKPVDEFLLLACDGLWTRHSPASATSAVRNRIAVRGHHASTCNRVHCDMPEHGQSLDGVCAAVLHDAVHNLGVKDNVTVVVARLHNTPLPP